MRTALITGGSRGIGAAAVCAFARASFRAAFFYRADEAAAQAVARETGAAAIRCDVSDPECVREACREAERTLGHIDALVNNAGIAQQKLLTDVTDEDWRRMLDVNLSGAFYVIRAVLPGMISRKHGSIVNVSSVWGQVGASCEAHYSAAKAGLIGLTRALAKEVGPSGVTVNCVCPGVIQTDMLGGFTPGDLKALAEETPLGRLGTPQEVAAAIVWLCQEDAAFVTGQVLGVGGGFGA
ncbi:MAG TPA: 3-oxoacyl-ACP reductase FabG [Candidatus Limiplasma pullicola]|nr:3-oxoacyl-ACP reductase FabG [Candidatus Limiplasma pullicola]